MQSPKKSRLPKFGLWTMMLITFVCAVTAAVGSYFVKAVQTGPKPSGYSAKGIFIMFALVAPMVMLILASGFYQISRMTKSKRKKKRRYTQE